MKILETNKLQETWKRKCLPQRNVLWALLKRNWLYRRRNLVGSILEIALPVLVLLALLLLKSVNPGKQTTKNTKFYNASVPNASEVFIPLTFGDYVTALQAKRQCYTIPKGRYKGLLGITGMPNGQYDWQVPFVRCNDMQCQFPGQDAQPFCEYLILGIAPQEANDAASRQRAVRFRDWIWEQYPVLLRHRREISKYGNTTLPFRFDFVQLFDSRNDMDDYIRALDYGTSAKPKLALGVLWAGGNATDRYQYYLRQNATLFNVPAEQDHPAARTTPDTKRMFDAHAKDDEWCEMAYGAPFLGDRQYSCTGQYLYNGVLTLQNLIGKFILQDSGAWQTFPVAEAGVAFVPFPSPAYKDGGFFSNLAELVGVMICLGLLMPVASMVGSICREKELRQKELMQMMGVTEAEIGWSWFISFVLFYVLVVASIVSVVSFQLYEHSNEMTLWGFWILTFTALITYCMALSALVSNGTRGVVIGIMMTLMGAFLVMAYSFWKGQAGIIQLLSLHPVAAFSYGLQEVGRLEDAGIGVVESTIESTDGPSGYTFWMCIRMLQIDIALWGLLAWYLNRVITPVYGTALPFYFPFTRSYWFGPKAREETASSDSSHEAAEESTGSSTIPIEAVSQSMRQLSRSGQGIEIRGLEKRFGNHVAVDKLSMSMYKGQVTALLGHNGAGKTTTISMLTGTLLPTAGYSVICGRDTRSHMNDIRKNIGICLQHDCLFPQLTVREHLEFFARIKGVYSHKSKAEAEHLVEEAIRDVALSDKSNAFSRNLSGGMKRKLSVAIAFCGGSETVILDEPTSGMDPFSRRFTWNVIRHYRKGRVILLTTHFMDEADILGDRIAIMSDGRLCCLGSALFLKKTFGVGYQLTLELPNTSKGQKQSNHKKLQKIITQNVEEAVLLSHVGSEMAYRLPVGAASRFGPMFDKLDRAIRKKRIVSYGVGVTTLEEVFLQVSRGEDKALEREKSGLARSACLENDKVALEDDSTRFIRHTRALFKKRVSNFRRDKKAWLCTTLLPSLFVFTGFLSIKLIPNERDFRPLALNIEDYNVDATTPRNPIGVNSPTNPFSCQPGYCAYNESEALHDLNETNESYFFCGEQARFDWYSNHTCTISIPTVDVVSRITDAGASPVVQNVSTIVEASSVLWNSSNAYMASQYGAIYFTRDSSSIVLETGELYDDEAYYTCEETYEYADYMSLEDCDSFAGLGYVISYNYTAYHVSPTFQVLATQSLAREAKKTNDFHIDCVLDPLPITRQEMGFSDEDKAFNAWYLVVLGFPFVAGAYAMFVVEEKESKSKHLQTVAGVSPAAYWVSTFLWDVTNYIIPMGITILLMIAFDVKMLTTSKKDVFSGVIVLLVLFGPASASFTYCISQMFRSPSRCSIFIILQGFFFGVGGPLAVLYLQIYGREIWKPQPKLLVAANAISWVMRFNPFFNLGKGLLYAIYIETIHLIEKGVFTAWSSDILKYEVIFLAWQSIAYLVLAIVLDKSSANPRNVEIFKRIVGFFTLEWLSPKQRRIGTAAGSLPEDDDVLAEQTRVETGQANDDLIVLNKLSKVYSNGTKAVDRMSLGIAPGECFGLLGINGAGKTTTMQMLTAEFPPTSGDAKLAGYSVTNSPEKTRSLIGYCPQFDAHFPNLTGREHVELYARIKGIVNAEVRNAVSRKLEQVGLSAEDGDRVASEYSGGMKRRLSLACAMIGRPRLVFLDEVSTGVDPVARREIWRLVSDLVKQDDLPVEEKTSVILTTHSMEECEALCPRLGIMANGRLRCLGSAQHLKNKFGKGFQIELKAKLVKKTDHDYCEALADLRQMNVSGHPSVFLPEAMDFLREITGDESLASMIDGSDPAGYAIFKDATSEAGVQVVDLAAFVAFEKRIHGIKQYIERHFYNSFFRERQDTKVRFEIDSKGIRISEIFASIESNKKRLRLAEYSVSQTTLEQVFNQHAKEAEDAKHRQVEEALNRPSWVRAVVSLCVWSKYQSTAEKGKHLSVATSEESKSKLPPARIDQNEATNSEKFDEEQPEEVISGSQTKAEATPTLNGHNRLLSSQSPTHLLPLYNPLYPLWAPSQSTAERDNSSTVDSAADSTLSSRSWLSTRSERFLAWLEEQLAAHEAGRDVSLEYHSDKAPVADESATPDIAREGRASFTDGSSSSDSSGFFNWLEEQVAAYKEETHRLSTQKTRSAMASIEAARKRSRRVSEESPEASPELHSYDLSRQRAQSPSAVRAQETSSGLELPDGSAAATARRRPHHRYRDRHRLHVKNDASESSEERRKLRSLFNGRLEDLHGNSRKQWDDGSVEIILDGSSGVPVTGTNSQGSSGSSSTEMERVSI